MTERRTRRSPLPGVAARYYLEALAERQGYDAVALSDSDGLLLADAGSANECEAVAAVAPLASDGRVDVDGLLGLVTRGKSLQVWPVDLQGTDCYLAAIGGLSEPPRGAHDALNRIFA